MKSIKRYMNAILAAFICTSMHSPAMQPTKQPTISGEMGLEYPVSEEDKKTLQGTLQDLQSTISTLDDMLKNPSLYEPKKITNAKEQKKIINNAIVSIKAMLNGETLVDWNCIEELMDNLEKYPV